jgi:hypothetical protein
MKKTGLLLLLLLATAAVAQQASHDASSAALHSQCPDRALPTPTATPVLRRVYQPTTDSDANYGWRP